MWYEAQNINKILVWGDSTRICSQFPNQPSETVWMSETKSEKKMVNGLRWRWVLGMFLSLLAEVVSRHGLFCCVLVERILPRHTKMYRGDNDDDEKKMLYCCLMSS